MSAIEIIALVIVAVSILKIIVLAISPRAWFNTAGRIIGPGWGTKIVLLILGAVVLKYLLVDLTIVEIYASTAFMIIVMWLSLAQYKQKMWDAVVGEMTAGNLWKKAWLPLIIWTVLTIWVLKEIF